MKRNIEDYKMEPVTEEELLALLRKDPIDAEALRKGMYLTPECVDRIIACKSGVFNCSTRWGNLLRLRDLVRNMGYPARCRHGGLIILDDGDGTDYQRRSVRRSGRMLLRSVEDLNLHMDPASLTTEERVAYERINARSTSMVSAMISVIRGPAKITFKRTAEKIRTGRPLSQLENR